MNKHSIIGIGGLLAAAGSLGLWLAAGSGSEHGSNAALVEQVAELEARLAQLSNRLDTKAHERGNQFNIQLQPMPTAVDGPAAHVDAPVVTARPRTESAATPMQSTPDQADTARQQQEVAELEQAFANQEQDYGWSAQASDSITRYFDERVGQWDKYSSELSGVQCGGALCKMQVTHMNQEAADAFALEFPLTMAGEMSDISYDYQTLADGSVSVTLYLSRQIN